jgi:hypothetical protein
MHFVNTLSKMVVTLAIITIASHAGDRRGYQKPNVKIVTNLRTHEQITSKNDPRNERSAASLGYQYGSVLSYYGQNIHVRPEQPAVVIHTSGTQNYIPSTDNSNISDARQSFPQTQNIPSAPPAPSSTSTSRESDSLLYTSAIAVPTHSTFDIESSCQHNSTGRIYRDSLERAFNATYCMNALKVVTFSVVVVCLFTGSFSLTEQGSAMMTHAGPNAKTVSYIAHADDDKTYFTDDVHDIYSDDDYITYINGDPHQVNNHHHLVPTHTRNKHVVNNHFHEVTRYRCEGSGCNEYSRGEFRYGLGIAGIIATAAGAVFLIVNQCFAESSY